MRPVPWKKSNGRGASMRRSSAPLAGSRQWNAAGSTGKPAAPDLELVGIAVLSLQGEAERAWGYTLEPPAAVQGEFLDLHYLAFDQEVVDGDHR